MPTNVDKDTAPAARQQPDASSESPRAPPVSVRTSTDTDTSTDDVPPSSESNCNRDEASNSHSDADPQSSWGGTDAGEEQGADAGDSNEVVDPVQQLHGRAWREEVTYDLLHKYEAHELHATKMYMRPHVLPIALHCMGYGVPNFPQDLQQDSVINKTLKRGSGHLFNASQLLPTNKTTGKKYLLKELIRRKILAEVDELPRCKNYTIKQTIALLQASPPPEHEHSFILSKLDDLRHEVDEHYSGNSHAAEASLNRHMRFVEVILHPDIARDWRERNMQKSRPVLDAECSHSSQCETNDHLITVWVKATKLYNDATLVLKSRVFADYGPPFDEEHIIHPVGEAHRLQPETFRKKYTDSRGTIDKLRGSLHMSGEGEGSYASKEVQRFTDSTHDFYAYMALQEADRVADYCQSLSDEHAASMLNVPSTTSTKSKTPSSKKPRHSSPHPESLEAINRIASSLERIGDAPTDRLRDLKELLQNDEANLLSHQSKLGDFGEKYAPYYEKFEAREIDAGHFLYKLHKSNYEDCAEQVDTIKTRISKTKKEIDSLEEDIQSSFLTPQRRIPAGGTSDVASSDEDVPSDPFAGDVENISVHEGVDVTNPLDDSDINDSEEFD